MIIEKKDFDKMVELAVEATGHGHMRPVIEKELLHYDILYALDQEDLLDKITFQGGTSLRLCYGAARYSEDLDFAGGVDFTAADMMLIKECLENYIGGRYGLEVYVKEPREMSALPERESIKVNKWQIAVVTSPGRKDLPRQKIKIEVANIPAYSRVPRALMHNYQFLPDGYRDTLIMTESLSEIMADKIISLVVCQKYIRHRDIWDLNWLKREGAVINLDYLRQKINDYRVENYMSKLKLMCGRLEGIINSDAFMAELSRFTPQEVQKRTLHKDKFRVYLINEITELLNEVKKSKFI